MNAAARLSTRFRDTSFRCSVNSTDYRLHSGSTSSWPSLYTSVCTDWRPSVSRMNSAMTLTVKCSSMSSVILVIVTHCPSLITTVGDQAFPLAAAHTWNSLPQHVSSGNPLYQASEHVGRPTSSQSPSSCCCHVGHFNRSFVHSSTSETYLSRQVAAFEKCETQTSSHQ